MIIVFLFWFCLLIIAYALVAFPLIVALRGWLFPKPANTSNETPQVSVIIAAYNEQEEIGQRIENLLASDYPHDSMEILIASDGSTDRTSKIVERFAQQNVRLLEFPRQGKGQTLNAAVPHAHGDILVFSDANTQFLAAAIRKLVRNFADPRVGGVAGNQKYLRDATASLTADGETTYWSLETMLKQLQSRGGSATSATGGIYAIRKSLFQTVPDDAMDDFMISTGVIAHGFRLLFEPEAISFEPVAVQSKVEFSRKVRVITQGLRSVLHRRALLNPFRYGFYALQLFSHKVLRRILVVPFLIVLFVSPFLWHLSVFYGFITALQLACLAAIVLGLIAHRWNLPHAKWLTLPYFVALVNVAAFVAIGNTLLGRRIKRWEPERHRLFQNTGQGTANESAVP